MSVAVTGLKTYERDAVSRAFDEAMAHLGGMKRFVSPGMRVLIKPNLLFPISPDKHATTHPEVVRAVVKAVLDAGGVPILGECPGGTHAQAYLKRTYEQCGVAQVARELNCEIAYDTDPVPIPSKEGEQGGARPLGAAFLGRCDAVISVAKLKTHGFMRYTGAVKNLFGLVPGIHKAQYHVKYAQLSDFAAAILDIYEAAKPVLCVMDAVVGMEGNGPSGGSPRPIGALLAADNGHEMDDVCARMIGLAPIDVPTLKCAAERGLYGPDAVRTLGEDPMRFSVPDFKPPDHMKKAANVVGDLRIVKWITRPFAQPYPRFLGKVCTRCGVCVANCPPKALALGGSKPLLERKKCIACYCCHELCPSQAIRIR